MDSKDNTESPAAAFIACWQGSGAAERANYQLFLSELCDPLSVPRPNPARPDNADIARAFKGAHGERVEEVLATLAALGQVRAFEGRFAPVP